MATFRYKLRDNNIIIDYSFGRGNRYRASTGLKVNDSSSWVDKKQNVKLCASEPMARTTNQKLNSYKLQFEQMVSDIEYEGREISKDSLKNCLDIILGKKTKEAPKTLELMPFFKHFLEKHQDYPSPITAKPIATSTLKTYRNAYNRLVDFENANYSLTYDKINRETYFDLLGWLNIEGHSTNYTGTIIKILKTILNLSLDKGYHSSLEHTKKYFKKPSEDADDIYLSKEELDKIFKLKLENAHLDRARDLFLIGAHTGLRVADFNNLSEENIIGVNGTKLIQVRTSKTGKEVNIPINSVVNSILEKYNGGFPRRMLEQKINYAIKEIGKMAGINDKIKKHITKGGKSKEASFFKYELIKNHTARRSFCTNAYLDGMNIIDIMTFSGHKSPQTFLKYIKASSLEKAINLSNHKFFK